MTIINPITVHCGGKSIKYYKISQFSSKLRYLHIPGKGYLFHPDGVGNLLSLALIFDGYRVYFDAYADQAFYVFHDDGSHIKFARQSNGLYTYHVEQEPTDNTMFLTTVVK